MQYLDEDALLHPHSTALWGIMGHTWVQDPAEASFPHSLWQVLAVALGSLTTLKEVLVGFHALWAAEPLVSDIHQWLGRAVGRRVEEPKERARAWQEPRLQPWSCLHSPAWL